MFAAIAIVLQPTNEFWEPKDGVKIQRRGSGVPGKGRARGLVGVTEAPRSSGNVAPD